MVKIKPLTDHLVLKPKKAESKTKEGILLPETVDKEQPQEAKVLAVGPGKRNQDGKYIPMDIKVGAVVLYTKYGPNEIKIDDQDLLIAKEEDILAILENS